MQQAGHALVPELFLIVGLVAAVRRILVVTAELTGAHAVSGDEFRVSMIEVSARREEELTPWIDRLERFVQLAV